MSVYTILKNKDVRRILSSYDIGTLQSFRGISEGITNTNYFINTSSGKYVLTIFEDIKKSKKQKMAARVQRTIKSKKVQKHTGSAKRIKKNAKPRKPGTKADQ